MSLSEFQQTFHFRAAAPDGAVFAGQLLATTLEAALAELQRHGYLPLRVQLTPVRQSLLDTEIAFSARRLDPVRCEAFCRELSLLLGSGVAAAEALAVMASSIPRRDKLYRFVTGVRHGLRLGRNVPDAILGAGFDLPPDFVPVARAGTESAGLAPALTMLADAYAEANQFRRAFIGALAYPALLVCVAVVVLVLIASFVAPNLASLFNSMDRPVPPPIAILSAAAAFATANWLVLLIGIVAVLTFLAAAVGRPEVGRALRAAAFQLPLLGAALTWAASRRFAEMLRLCFNSNVPTGAALPQALEAAGFPGSRTKGRRIVEQVRAGRTLSAALQDAALLPANLLHLIRIGESSGRLPEVLAAVASEAKNQFEQRMGLFSTLLAPVLILVVGSVIGGIIFSVFTALLDVNTMAY